MLELHLKYHQRSNLGYNLTFDGYGVSKMVASEKIDPAWFSCGKIASSNFFFEKIRSILRFFRLDENKNHLEFHFSIFSFSIKRPRATFSKPQRFVRLWLHI